MLKKLGFVLGLGFLLSGCTPDTPDTADNTLSLKFNVNAGNTPLLYNTNYMLDTMIVQFMQVRFYMCQPEFSSGSEIVSFPDSYFLGEAGQENVWVVGDVGKRIFDGIAFGFGVDSSRNTQSGSKAIPAYSYPVDHALSASNNMYWAWNPGYIWMKLEGRMDANMDGDVDDPTETFSIHTGVDQAYLMVSRPAVFEMNNAPKTLQVDMDILKFFDGHDLVSRPFAHPLDTASMDYSTMVFIQNNANLVFGNFYE